MVEGDLGRNVRPVPIAHPKLFPLRRTTLLSAVIAHCRPLEYDEEAAFNPRMASSGCHHLVAAHADASSQMIAMQVPGPLRPQPSATGQGGGQARPPSDPGNSQG